MTDKKLPQEITAERKELTQRILELEIRLATVQAELKFSWDKLSKLPSVIQRPSPEKLPFGNPIGCPKLYQEKSGKNQVKLTLKSSDLV